MLRDFLYGKKRISFFILFFLYIIMSLSHQDVLSLPDDLSEESIIKSKIVFKDISEELRKNSIPISAAAITDRIVFHPVDTIVTLQQSHLHAKYAKMNFFHAAGYLYKLEGLGSFYKGFFWPTISVIPNRFVVFGTYYSVRRQLENFSHEQRYIFSSLVAALTNAVVSCPSEAERTRKICGIEVSNKFAPKNLFKGLFPLSIKHVSALAPTLAGTDILLHKYITLKESPLSPFLIATVISFICQPIATPVDMFKTRVMEDYSDKSLMYHIRQLKKDSHLLFKTFWSRAMRSSAGAGLTVGVIHLVQYLIGEEN